MTNPLSPHLQVYRWQVTSVLSILHRITGVVTSLGSMLLVFYMISFAFSSELFDFINFVLPANENISLLSSVFIAMEMMKENYNNIIKNYSIFATLCPRYLAAL